MNTRIFYIGILTVWGATTGLALKCYSCINMLDANCFNNVGPNFLKGCPSNTAFCSTEIKGTGKTALVYRKCVPSNWTCQYSCYTCSTDGCNNHNDVEDENPNPTIVVTPMEIIMANIYGIGAISLIVVLLLIWIIVKACSKNKDAYYDEDCEVEMYDDYAFAEVEDEDEDEEDYDYEDDDDVDDDYDGDSIEKEYDEYEKEAEKEYKKTKQRKGKEMV